MTNRGRENLHVLSCTVDFLPLRFNYIPELHLTFWYNLLTAITSRVATLSKDHVTIEYHVMCLVFCMYSTLYSVQYGEILLS